MWMAVVVGRGKRRRVSTRRRREEEEGERSGGCRWRAWGRWEGMFYFIICIDADDDDADGG
jgi:hypothetical protein